MYNNTNPNTHNRLVAGSNPAEPTKSQVFEEVKLLEDRSCWTSSANLYLKK